MKTTYQVEKKSNTRPTRFISQDKRKKILFVFIAGLNSRHSKIAYKREVEKFFFFLEEYFPGQDEFFVESAHIVAYKNYLEGQQSLSPSSVNRASAALFSLFITQA